MSMQQLEQWIRKDQNVLFIKPGCPYCARAIEHAKKLRSSGKIKDFTTYTVEKDFSNRDLGNLVDKNRGRVQSDGTATKPQVFIGGRYVGDSEAFLKKIKA